MRKRKLRRYTAEEKQTALTALALNNNDLYRTAKELGIPWGTLHHWARLQQLVTEAEVSENNAPLDDQLEHLVRQMVAVMPAKVEEASLQELTRSLSIVLATMNEARAGKDEGEEDVYEKLARLMDRFTPARPADSDLPTADEDSTLASGE